MVRSLLLIGMEYWGRQVKRQKAKSQAKSIKSSSLHKAQNEKNLRKIAIFDKISKNEQIRG
jgi:hypothetical protein